MQVKRVVQLAFLFLVAVFAFVSPSGVQAQDAVASWCSGYFSCEGFCANDEWDLWPRRWHHIVCGGTVVVSWPTSRCCS